MKYLLLSLMVVTLVAACEPLAGGEDPYYTPEGDMQTSPPAGLLQPPAVRTSIRCMEFLNQTVELRRDIVLKQFEYFEAVRRPESQAEAFTLEAELRDLLDQLYILAPPECMKRPRF